MNKQQKIKKPDLRDIFDESVKDIKGTDQFKDGFFRGAKEVVELINAKLKYLLDNVVIIVV